MSTKIIKIIASCNIRYLQQLIFPVEASYNKAELAPEARSWG